MAVLFLPQMVEVIEGAPEERRRFLNLAMSQVIPGFGRILADYSQTLSQRNALLKQLQEFGGDTNQLDYWDELLVSKGSEPERVTQIRVHQNNFQTRIYIY